ncbi:major facilitator superfamily domain-containing protein [Lipomyces oligophaga]|uniref:major facilitator superfamily domain-containing protein n=1 Tax=Lipomyces oligophaga TaxID=45792 RepID=UPI0034CD08A2
MVYYHDISVARRLLQITLAFSWCLLAAGPVFGFAALKTVWLREGVYAYLCAPEETETGYICSSREIRMNFVFTCASVVSSFASVIVGAILDRFGPRNCNFLSGLLIGAGALMLAFADSISLLDLYIWGYITLAFGGPFLYISSFHLSNAFPAFSGFILALLTGAFGASTAVYLVYRLIYSETEGRFHPKAFFLLYLIVPISIIIGSATVMPSESYKQGCSIGKFLEDEEDDSYTIDSASIDGIAIDSRTGGGIVVRAEHKHHSPVSPTTSSAIESVAAMVNTQDSDDEIEDRLVDEQAALLSKTDRRNISPGDYEYDSEEMHKLKISGIWGALHGRTAWQQIKTPWFVILCLFSMIMTVRVNYFVATVRSHYDFIFKSPEAARIINEFFDIALPVGGIISVPLAGLLLDHCTMALCLTILVVMSTAMGVLSNFASYPAAYLNIVIFSLYRAYFYTAISDYVAKVFGFETFGTIYGLVFTITGVFNFGQSGFDHLTHRVLNRDPRPVNIALITVSTAVGIWFVWYVSSQARRIRRSALEMEAEQATALRMPGYAASLSDDE